MQHIIHLSRDKKLARIMARQEPFPLVKYKNVHIHLCTSIMSQQLSTRVAAVFHERFFNLYPNKKPTARQIMDTPFETLRSIGLSNAKTNYIQNVCKFWIGEKITDAKLHKLSNKEIAEYLTRIKGVGNWTVEMLLMFTLGREDVFSVDDLGIQQAMCKLYKIDAGNKKAMKEKMTLISQKWAPYQTYACRYLWGWKDDGA
jgi:DNA-3-methyladenine glycosylase II